MKTDQVSAVILAGGYSSRMGSDKAALKLGDRTLLEIQTDKCRRLGITDIMLSGTEFPLDGTRQIPDRIPHRGPVSGLHACLQAAEKAACLVLGVDVPLVPEETLAELICAHEEGITVLAHGDRIEPLIAIYDSSLAERAESIARAEKSAMMKMLDFGRVKKLEYVGDETLLTNCNTPEDFRRMEERWNTF